LATAHQQGSHAVGAVGVVGIRMELHPLGGEPQHPAVETVYPYRIVGHPAGECRHSVRAVPFGELLKVGCKGMVFADAARAHKALDIPIPAVYACFDGLHAERVHPSFVHFGVTQMGIGNVVCYFCHFGFLGQHVEAEAVAGGEESGHFLHQGG